MNPVDTFTIELVPLEEIDVSESRAQVRNESNHLFSRHGLEHISQQQQESLSWYHHMLHRLHHPRPKETTPEFVQQHHVDTTPSAPSYEDLQNDMRQLDINSNNDIVPCEQETSVAVIPSNDQMEIQQPLPVHRPALSASTETVTSLSSQSTGASSSHIPLMVLLDQRRLAMSRNETTGRSGRRHEQMESPPTYDAIVSRGTAAVAPTSNTPIIQTDIPQPAQHEQIQQQQAISGEPGGSQPPPPSYESLYKRRSRCFRYRESRKLLLIAIVKVLISVEMILCAILFCLTGIPVMENYAIPSIGTFISSVYFIFACMGRYGITYQTQPGAKKWMFLFAISMSVRWIADAGAVLTPIWNVSMGKTNGLEYPKEWNLPLPIQVTTAPVMGIRYFYGGMFPCSQSQIPSTSDDDNPLRKNNNNTAATPTRNGTRSSAPTTTTTSSSTSLPRIGMMPIMNSSTTYSNDSSVLLPDSHRPPCPLPLSPLPIYSIFVTMLVPHFLAICFYWISLTTLFPNSKSRRRGSSVDMSTL